MGPPPLGRQRATDGRRGAWVGVGRTLGRLGGVLAAFGAGQIFASGLVLSGMTRPDEVLAFLDVRSGWRPTLLVVLGVAVAVYALLRHTFTRILGGPVLADRFEAPPTSTLDGRLLLGAAIFGVGWGVSGRCPGPALASLGGGALDVVLFVVAMVAGQRLVDRALVHPSTPTGALATE